MNNLNSGRRHFLAAAGILAGSTVLPAFAQQSNQLNLGVTALVEIFNFRCVRCRAVSDYADRISLASEKTGVIYRPAPISWDLASVWPDRFYYAVRDLYPKTAHIFREAIFSGVHDYGQGFEELAQLMAYMESRQVIEKALKIDINFNLVAVADRAGTDDTLYPLAKAIRLLELSAAQEVPVFIWLKGGSVMQVISPAYSADPSTLARKVLADLTKT